MCTKLQPFAHFGGYDYNRALAIERVSPQNPALACDLSVSFAWPCKNISIDSESRQGGTMDHLRTLWSQEEGQDIAEYAVMLAVILVIVVGTIRLIGSNSNTVFSNVSSAIQ